MSSKFVRDSRVEQVHMLMYGDMNGYGRLFGGRLMEWIDVVAGVVSRRHSGCDVTTAAIDRLDFIAPAYIGDTVVLEGVMTYTGRTSMEVRVDTYVEKLSGSRERINRAYLVMVALDPEGKPAPVPALIPESIEEKAEFEAGKKRKKARSRK